MRQQTNGHSALVPVRRGRPRHPRGHRLGVSRYESGRSEPRRHRVALGYVEEGSFGSVPETIHEKAFHLLRFLVADHPFVDGNKRTALNTVSVFYRLNGYQLEYDDEIIDILKQFGTDEATVDEERILAYLRSNSRPIDLNDEISNYREELIHYGLEEMTDETSDPND
nr:type II toxin-antitoxin system death-on-curing family toxin [Halomicrobium urmianum]